MIGFLGQFDLPHFFATKVENEGRRKTVVSCLFIFDIQRQNFGSLYSLQIIPDQNS